MLELQNGCASLFPVQGRKNLSLFPFEAITQNKQKKERGQEMLLTISVAGGQVFWRVFCSFIAHTEEANCRFHEKVCHAPDGISQPHIPETTKKNPVHFSPALLLLALGGQGDLKGLLWYLKQHASQQLGDLHPHVQSPPVRFRGV